VVEPPTASIGTGTISYSEVADLPMVRAFVYARACALGLSSQRADLLTLAVSELATNTLQHTNGGGHIRVWIDAGRLTCDVEDGGAVPVMGRPMPAADAEGGRGLPIVEQVCDEVTIMPSTGGTLVRLRFTL
jgi:serine/threonine-protein kinase RsbW